MSEWTKVRVDKLQRIKTSEWDKGQRNLDFCETLTLKKDINFHCFLDKHNFKKHLWLTGTFFHIFFSFKI